MKIKSLISENESLVAVEVEITLLPGLPQIQFLGLPDQIIRESTHRIKCALRQQGFDLPKAHQIIVNIRPNHLKKSSRGLELAVAAGLLWQTGQIAPPEDTKNLVVYGELGLEGEVREPEDLALYFEDDTLRVLSGTSLFSKTSFDRLQITELKDLVDPIWIARSEALYAAERPMAALNNYFPAKQARLLEITALGEHSLMLAGPAGSGKTTLAKALTALMREPSSSELKQIKKIARSHGNWRPVVQPHHSSTPLSLIGGGVPPSRGEFARAHLGLLIMDEFLEFPPKAQEALREPMEEGFIRLSRSSRVAEFPAQAQVVACTNLCPCGDWVPKSRVRCMRSLSRCKDYVNRLSGPLADRFQILFFTEKYRRETGVSGLEILKRVEAARKFRADQAGVSNARLGREVLIKQMDAFTLKNLLPQEFSSRRRELATLRVARSLADLAGSAQIKGEHLEEALDFSWRSFEQLKSLD